MTQNIKEKLNKEDLRFFSGKPQKKESNRNTGNMKSL
jgi:hypothetical protein